MLLLASLGGGFYWLNQRDHAEDGVIDNDENVAKTRDRNRPRGSGTRSGDVSRKELLDQLLESQNQPEGQIPVLNYEMHIRRAELAERLLEMDLNKGESIWVTDVLIQSLSSADWINSEWKLEMAGTRAALLAAGDKYANHSNPAIASLANLALTLAPLNDFWKSRDSRDLERFQEQFDLRQDKLLQSPKTAQRLAHVSVNLKLADGFESKTTPLLMHILRRYEQETSPDIVKGTMIFREVILFYDLDAPNLAGRVTQQRPEAADQVNKLFEGLASYPDVGLDIYRHAISVIQAYQEQGETKETVALEKRLREIANKIPDEEKRNTVLADLEGL